EPGGDPRGAEERDVGAAGGGCGDAAVRTGIANVNRRAQGTNRSGQCAAQRDTTSRELSAGPGATGVCDWDSPGRIQGGVGAGYHQKINRLSLCSGGILWLRCTKAPFS